MHYKNAKVFLADNRFHRTGFSVESGVFAQVHTEYPDALDLEGQLVIPGLVDLHTHGNSGVAFADGKESSLHTMARYLASNGITSFSATSVSDPEDRLQAAYQVAASMWKAPPHGCAKLVGITMEGPFLSKAKKGAMDEKNLRAPDVEMFRRLNRAADGLIKIVAVAPELEGAQPFLHEISKEAKVSLAHTTASYDTAASAFGLGASHVTHLFNAMPPLLHRDPGVIGAAADASHVTVELIADGLHVHASALRAAWKLFGPARIILISDAVEFCGLPEGQYGGYTVKDGKVTLPDGTLAGSTTHLFECMRRAERFGFPREAAIRCATRNPAEALGLFDRIGSIEVGKDADFLVCSDEMELKQVFIGGLLLH